MRFARSLIIASALGLLFTTGAHAQAVAQAAPVAQDHSVDDWKMHLALAVSMAADGSDLATTFELLGRQHECEHLFGPTLSKAKGVCPGFREANPILAPFSNDSFKFGAVKMGIAAIGIWGQWQTHTTHPKIARACAWGNAALKFWVASRNARLINQQH